jgi:membrane protease YdiL (CAAX protease family)
MHESNQATPPGIADPAPAASPPLAGAGLAPPVLDDEAARREARAGRGLFQWVAVTLMLGALSLAVSQAETGALLILALLLAVSQAGDVLPRLRFLARAMEWMVQVPTALALVAFITLIDPFAPEQPLVRPMQVYMAIAAAFLAVTLPARAGDGMARVLFREPRPSLTLVLAARLVVATLLICVPLWFVFQRIPELFELDGQIMLGSGELVASMLGYNVVALAGVGWLVRRDLRQALRRLGVEPIRGTHWVWVIVGTAALFALATGGEWLQKTYFPSYYAADRRFDEMLAGSLTGAGMVLLGISAGLGEELTIRGALQPRLGLWLTAILFGVMHVQYSIVGVAFITLFGLTLGWLRLRTSTSVAILVHALYDAVALFLTRAQSTVTV